MVEKMQISANGLSIIKYYEGFRNKSYVCPGGKLTIGYGHVLVGDELSTYSKGITREQAELLLKNDVKVAEGVVNRLTKVRLSQYQFDALVSLVYNIGGRAFRNSTLLKVLNNEDYNSACIRFGDFVKSGGKVLPGLVTRRKVEAELFARVVH